jgi:phosphate transport system permease protein
VRTTRRSVFVAEKLAKGLIFAGGFGTIAAVLLILGFLGWVVLPLFAPADWSGGQAAEPRSAERVLLYGVDEYQQFDWSLTAAGEVQVHRWNDGARVSSHSVGPAELRVAAMTTEDGALALGYADGSVRLGSIGFRAGQLQLELQEPVSAGSSAIVALDRTLPGSKTAFCALDAQGNLIYEEIQTRENMLTGEQVREVSKSALPLALDPARGMPQHLRLSGAGDVLILAWSDGHALRYDLRDPDKARVVETLELCAAGARLTTLEWLLGQSTLLVGDDRGGLSGWFGTKPADANTGDGVRFVAAHSFASGSSPVRSIASSSRNRVFAAAFEDGSVQVVHATSATLLMKAVMPAAVKPQALALAPKEDGLAVRLASGALHYKLDLMHPDAGLAALFLPVWYEGYEKPEHVWQSSSGTDDFEAKLGLYPLIFGTLKATFYSLLFGAPLALLAALFTSEFLSRRWRVPLKSVIELMASLPSVVLGFIAALVIAPALQDSVPEFLTVFVTVPFMLFLGAYCWQLLPRERALLWSGIPRMLAMVLMIPIGVLLAIVLGPAFEAVLFAGDLKAWLDGRIGSGTGGWVFLLLPLSGVLAAALVTRNLGPWLRARASRGGHARAARQDLFVFLGLVAGTIAVAFVIGASLDGLGFDPRGGVLDTYVQRNALIVGFVMGFAIIPIIYTLAEDAISSVPAHLRHASLGAGATQWQTAIRVVVPTAMSGIFSALMIGTGRAVGETMIVLMATGNTPVMSWNVFNGFRTLSANIAVELPEAVKNSTHYRTLFLAALCLFALTFVFNTLAEIVRQRFRKRSVQL